MLNLKQSVAEDILNHLDRHGYPFAQYQFYRKDNQIQVIGKGGFSVVYDMVERKDPQKHYAMKVIGLKQQVVSSAEFWDTFRIQRILSEDSPYVVQVLKARELQILFDENGSIREIFDVDGEQDRWTEDGWILQFILMEKLEELVYRDKYRKTSLVRPELHEEKEVLKFAIEIGHALACAHDNCVLHRDIKLENIFWDAKTAAYKLGDFGIAKYVENGNAETIVYTDGYGAPEIERRLQKHYNATADIYSFGITLYLLLNRLRFPGSAGYYVNLIQYDPEFEFPAPEEASELMTGVIRKMCRYDYTDRYQSMGEVLTALDQVRDSDKELEAYVSVDYADLRTETFHEERNGEKSETEPGGRADRIAYRHYLDRYYKKASALYLIGFSVLFALLFYMWQPDADFIKQWEFWVVPIVVLLESILLRMKEFHFIFGFFTIFLLIYSMTSVGVTVPHIAMTVSVCAGVPGVTAGCAIGTGIWMLFLISNKLAFLNNFINPGLGWIVFAAILIFFARYVLLRTWFFAGETLQSKILIHLLDKLPVFSYGEMDDEYVDEGRDREDHK